jgi:hypothetical protein
VHAALDDVGRPALGVREAKAAFQLPAQEYKNLKAKMEMLLAGRDCLVIELNK